MMLALVAITILLTSSPTITSGILVSSSTDPKHPSYCQIYLPTSSWPTHKKWPPFLLWVLAWSCPYVACPMLVMMRLRASPDSLTRTRASQLGEVHCQCNWLTSPDWEFTDTLDTGYPRCKTGSHHNEQQQWRYQQCLNTSNQPTWCNKPLHAKYSGWYNINQHNSGNYRGTKGGRKQVWTMSGGNRSTRCDTVQCKPVSV